MGYAESLAGSCRRLAVVPATATGARWRVGRGGIAAAPAFCTIATVRRCAEARTVVRG